MVNLRFFLFTVFIYLFIANYIEISVDFGVWVYDVTNVTLVQMYKQLTTRKRKFKNKIIF